MPKTGAMVITGYHGKEAEFGNDVTRHYEEHELKRGRNIVFYSVRSKQQPRLDRVVPEADAEIRDYLSTRALPDVFFDVHIGAADIVWPKGAEKADYEHIDILCAKVPFLVVCELSRLMGGDHVLSDVVFPWTADAPDDLAHETSPSEKGWPDLTIAQTGVPTIKVEPYLFHASIRGKDEVYWHRVSQTARLINTMYDFFEERCGEDIHG